MIDTALALLIFAVLLTVVGVCQPLAARLRLPPPVLLGVVGVTLGVLPATLSRLGAWAPLDAFAAQVGALPISSSAYIYLFLPPLVFEAGVVTDVRRMLSDAVPILVLAIVATVVTTMAIGLALWPVSGTPLLVCLLLGAVVSTTDPAAVIAIFRDVGAPARLTRLAEGEALLNDAAAIVLFAVLFGMIATGREPSIAAGVADFLVTFVGGGVLGLLAGRAMLAAVPWLRDDRLAEATLTLALSYGVFVVAERFLHVSGVVAVLVAGLVLSASGQSRIAPGNWTFLVELWEQIAFWARSLVFVLASILVPQLLGPVGLHDLALLAVLIAAAFAARLAVLFGLVPLLEFLNLSQPISAAYKLAIAWGGLRGALTLVLALAATEHPQLSAEAQRFIAVLATGFVLFTLFVNGTTLGWVIRLLRLDRLSPLNQVLRDRVLALSYAEVCDAIRARGREHALGEDTIWQVIEPYQTWIAAADARDAGERLKERERLAIALVALASQERVLVLQARADRAASPAIQAMLLANADALLEAARTDGRAGYRRTAGSAIAYSRAFRFAHFLHRHVGLVRPLGDRLADRVELLLLTRLLLDRLAAFNRQRLGAMFGARIAGLAAAILTQRRRHAADALDALRRQYPEFVAALETRALRQSALGQELAHYRALFDEGLIQREVYDDLYRSVAATHGRAERPRFDIGLDTRRLVERLDLLAGLDALQLDRVVRLLRPVFTVPGELVIRAGSRADACYFIANGAVEVRRPDRRIGLGSGDFFGELALLTGRPRQADVVALTYCRLLQLRRADFEDFLAANPDARVAIRRIAAARQAENRESGLFDVPAPQEGPPPKVGRA